MKNASQIINILQHKPQFSKLSTSKCIDTLKSSLLPSIQKNIKHGYIHNNILYFILTSRLSKLDTDNIINNIKMILNSPMILQSQKFTQCLGINIEDVKIYTDNKPKRKIPLFQTTSHILTYKERTSKDLTFHLNDPKLQEIMDDIAQIIEAKR